MTDRNKNIYTYSGNNRLWCRLQLRLERRFRLPGLPLHPRQPLLLSLQRTWWIKSESRIINLKNCYVNPLLPHVTATWRPSVWAQSSFQTGYTFRYHLRMSLSFINLPKEQRSLQEASATRASERLLLLLLGSCCLRRQNSASTALPVSARMQTIIWWRLPVPQWAPSSRHSVQLNGLHS